MKIDSLKNTAEFDFVYRNAFRFFHKNFVLYAHRLSGQTSKELSKSHQRILKTIRMREAGLYLGLSVSKKIGKAHTRNLIKRRVRAIMYESREEYADYIFVFVAKAPVVESGFSALKADLHYSVTRLKRQGLNGGR